MIIVDANVLLSAYNDDSPHCGRARIWWERALQGHELIGLTWVVVMAFVRIATSHRVFNNPMSANEAIEAVASWVEQDAVEFIHPGDRHLAFLREQLIEGQATGNLAMDAHLAALAVERAAAICTFDRDFARFTGIRTIQP